MQDGNLLLNNDVVSIKGSATKIWNSSSRKTNSDYWCEQQLKLLLPMVSREGEVLPLILFTAYEVC